MSNRFSIVVLVSGSGSNLQSLIDVRAAGKLDLDISAVIANRPGAHALERAKQAGIETRVIDHRAYAKRQDFDQALQSAIDSVQFDLVVLAGFMRRLSDAFVMGYTARMINLHPSLLPAYRGLDTYERCLADAVTVHGTSVHFVTPEIDSGPVIAQAEISVVSDDTVEALKARVQAREHVLLPEVLRWFIADRVRLIDGGVYFDGHKLDKPILLTEGNELVFPHARAHTATGPVVGARSRSER